MEPFKRNIMAVYWILLRKREQIKWWFLNASTAALSMLGFFLLFNFMLLFVSQFSVIFTSVTK